MYFSISSYADNDCQIEILNKETISPERYHSDYAGMVNKSVFDIHEKS